MQLPAGVLRPGEGDVVWQVRHRPASDPRVDEQRQDGVVVGGRRDGRRADGPERAQQGGDLSQDLRLDREHLGLVGLAEALAARAQPPERGVVAHRGGAEPGEQRPDLQIADISLRERIPSVEPRAQACVGRVRAGHRGVPRRQPAQLCLREIGGGKHHRVERVVSAAVRVPLQLIEQRRHEVDGPRDASLRGLDEQIAVAAQRVGADPGHGGPAALWVAVVGLVAVPEQGEACGHGSLRTTLTRRDGATELAPSPRCGPRSCRAAPHPSDVTQP